MAKFYSSTFGAISGKHGSAVAVTRKDGTTYIRMYAKPSNPRTDKQQAHRAKFALSSKALVPFNPIFKDTIGITNGISTARSHTFKNAIVGEYPNFSVEYEKLMFSFGSLEKLHNASATSSDGVVTINWDFNKMYNCHGDDNINLVVFNKESSQAIHIKDVALRSDKVSKINIQDSWSNSELYFWAYVTSSDNISDSVFVGKCRPSDVISDSLIKIENQQDKDEYMASTESNIQTNESKYDYSSDSFNAKGAIVSFIVMLLNLIGLFKNVVVGVNMPSLDNALTYSDYCHDSGVEGRVKSRCYEGWFNSRLYSVSRNALERYCGKYDSILATISILISIPIMCHY